MNILKSIGGLFGRLWRWIRETAWVQPLLIVGGIFTIIFSFPKFTTWFNAMAVASGEGYYNSFKVSLEGEGRKDDGVAYMTPADKLAKTWEDFSNLDGEYTSYADYSAALNKAKGSAVDPLSYGEKYIVAFVGENCSGCESALPGFETLQSYWGTSFVAKDDRDFKFYTIFTDEVSSNDDDSVFQTDDSNTAFRRWINRWHETGLLDDLSYRMEETPYTNHASISESKYDHLYSTNDFETPTIFLVDFSEEAFNLGRPGVSECIFGVSGSDGFDKAKLLMRMWNHADTTDTQNPFSTVYDK